MLKKECRFSGVFLADWADEGGDDTIVVDEVRISAVPSSYFAFFVSMTAVAGATAVVVVVAVRDAAVVVVAGVAVAVVVAVVLGGA